MVRTVVLATVVLLGFPSLALANAWNGHGEAFTASNGIGWYYSAEQTAFFRVPTSFQATADGPDLEWSHVATCDGNSPGANGLLCLAALCTAPDGRPGTQFWVFSRPLDPPGSSWTLQGTQCVPGELRVDLADVEAEIRRVVEEKFREIVQPTIQLSPRNGGLVNLPVLAWTDDRGEVTLDIEQPLPGTVRATPSYEWTWSNGTTATGPGIPYSPGISPTAQPDRYVHAVYRQRGEASVTLTVTWEGDVSVPGVPPVDIEPLVYSVPASLAIREARAELVDPKG